MDRLYATNRLEDGEGDTVRAGYGRHVHSGELLQTDEPLFGRVGDSCERRSIYDEIHPRESQSDRASEKITRL